MPELPEVETVKNVLKKQILGLKINNIVVRYEKIIKNDLSFFINSLTNKTLIDIKRKGKFLIFILDDIAFLVHLRMEGKFFIKDSNEDYLKHEHVIFKLSNGMDLRYHDTRKFGMMMIKSLDDIYQSEPLSTLADEPFDINVDELYNRLLRMSKPIKEALLDQHVISGLGNIYADEVCFMAKINPQFKTNKLTKQMVIDIVNSSINVLNEAIKMGGTTIRSYTSSLNVSGRFQQKLYVHTRENKPCLLCQMPIKKIKVGGRGTYYCPRCQRSV